MKLVRGIINVLAVMAVLLASALPAHAHQLEHGDLHNAHAAHAVDDNVADAGSVPADKSGDPAMHCGAPILGPHPLSIGCVLRVSSIAYSALETAPPLDLTLQELRPPRR